MQNADNQPQKPVKTGRGRPKKGQEAPKFNNDEDQLDTEVFEGPPRFSTKRANLIGHTDTFTVWLCWVHAQFHLETFWGIDLLTDRRAIELMAHPNIEISRANDRFFHAMLACTRSTKAQLYELGYLLRERDPILSNFYFSRAVNKP
jgi:hypothetical protein